MSQIEQVIIDEVRSAGIVVHRLGDNQKGFIPRREVSWDRSVRNSPAFPNIGTQIPALVLTSQSEENYLLLSLRQMVNPWLDAESRYKVNQRVRGEIVNLRPNAAYVQVEPGIDGVIWSRDIPLNSGQLPTDVLQVGDQLHAVITKVDAPSKRLELSLVECLDQLPPDPAGRNAVQCDLLRCVPPSGEVMDDPQHNAKRADNRVYHPPIGRITRIMIVDDHADDLTQLIQLLHETYGVDIDVAESGRQALDLVNDGNRYTIAIIDVRLGNHHGWHVAEELFDADHELAFIFVSSDPQAEKEVGLIGGRHHPFALKQQLDSVIECVDKHCLGYVEADLPDNHSGYVANGGFVEQLGISAGLRRPLQEVLTEITHQLRLTTGISHVMVIRTNKQDRNASILAISPSLSSDIQRLSQDGLYYSPVRQVTEYEEEFYATNIRQDIDKRFKNFFPMLAISVCLGIPLTSPDLATGHALFLLDERRTELDEAVKDRAQLAAKLLETTLERADLLDLMQRYEQRYTHGQLLGSLTHELHVKLRGMDGQLKRLEGMLAQLEIPLQPSSYREYLFKASDAAAKLEQIKSNMLELIDAYARLVRGHFEPVDVNLVVRKAVSQLDHYARDAHVDLILDLGHSIPRAMAIDSRLEQIVINLILNAIQQISHQYEFFRKLNKHQRKTEVAGEYAPARLVIVKTIYCDGDPSYPVKIIVVDTGPGIHYRLQQRLFRLNTSTRSKGQGLGLYISRNLADFMDCRLQLVDSIMFIGSAFALELRQHVP